MKYFIFSVFLIAGFSSMAQSKQITNSKIACLRQMDDLRRKVWAYRDDLALVQTAKDRLPLGSSILLNREQIQLAQKKAEQSYLEVKTSASKLIGLYQDRGSIESEEQARKLIEMMVKAGLGIDSLTNSRGEEFLTYLCLDAAQ